VKRHHPGITLEPLRTHKQLHGSSVAILLQTMTKRNRVLFLGLNLGNLRPQGHH